jgi:aspartyl-tRNA(Asn)/glutamyl-tRNA(Gln) amidotransferase subunit A
MRPLNEVRLGVCEAFFAEGCEPAVAAAVKNAIASLQDHGAHVIPLNFPNMHLGIACYYTIATAEASSNLARFDGVRYGYRTRQPVDIHEMYTMSRGDSFGAEVKRRIMLGTFTLSSGYYDAYYLKALKVRSLIRKDFENAFEQVDAIVSPVAPTTAFAIGAKFSDPLAMYLGDVYTILANLAGLCAISLPCGLDPHGLPIGLQLMARSFGEETLLAIAHQYQCLTEHHAAAPPIAAATTR